MTREILHFFSSIKQCVLYVVLGIIFIVTIGFFVRYHSINDAYFISAVSGVSSSIFTTALLTIISHYQRDRKSRKIISNKITRLLEQIAVSNDNSKECFQKVYDEMCEESTYILYKKNYMGLAAKMKDMILSFERDVSDCEKEKLVAGLQALKDKLINQ